MKLCKVCFTNKELSEFNKEKSKIDGYSYMCKPCNKERCLFRYNKNRTGLVKNPNISKRCNSPASSNIPQKMYRSLLKQSAYRKIQCDITYEEYKIIREKKCEYCKGILGQINYVGLDRIDNNKSYTITNVVPCCGFCNKLKNNMLTFQETKILITKLIELRKKS